jgi:FkbM family methyltransferase
MDTKHAVKRLLYRLGYDVRRRGLVADLSTVMDRCLHLAGQVGTVVDVGASDGRWSRDLMRILPESRYLLLEAQEAHRRALEAFRARTGADFVMAAASDRTGSLHFYDDGNLFGGAASHEPFSEHDMVLPCVSVDEVIAERDLPGPYLLKLDTHGHEMEILRGAENVLKDAALVVLETYAFPDVSGFLFDEMCLHMRERGFRAAGIADVMVRGDGLLWQADIAFLPADNPAFARRGYFA